MYLQQTGWLSPRSIARLAQFAQIHNVAKKGSVKPILKQLVKAGTDYIGSQRPHIQVSILGTAATILTLILVSKNPTNAQACRQQTPDKEEAAAPR